MKKERKVILWIGLMAFCVMVIAYLLEAWTFKQLPKTPLIIDNPRVFRTLGLIAVGLITFYGFLWFRSRGNKELDESDMRTAITISLVSVYIVLVGAVVFYAPKDENSNSELPAISTTMITSFTGLIAVIVPFYFGASAYVQAKKEGAQKDSTPPPSENSTQK